MSDTLSAQRLAERVGAALFEKDFCAQSLGIALIRIAPGHAEMTMTVRHDMVNGHGICHGGMTFTLADTTFAYACNAANRATVASGCSIIYPAPARQGDLLTAVGRELHQQGRTGVYDVIVRTQAGVVVGVFRGQSRQIDGIVTTEEKDVGNG